MASESAVKSSVCQFTSKLYQHVIESQGGSLTNTFMAPLSVYATMAMTLSGSEGNTKSEMLTALQMPAGFGSSSAHQTIGSTLSNYFKSTKGVTLNLANGLFANAHDAIKDQFKGDLKAHYQAHVENLPFATDTEGSRKRINGWVAQETKDKIKELLAPGSVKSDTQAVLANALYFRGSWAREFPKDCTNDHDFHKLDGSKMTVKMMFLRAHLPSTRVSSMGVTIARLPFLESNWEMVIILPEARDGLKQLMHKMCDSNTLHTLLTTPCETEEIELFLPRFKLGEGDAMDMVPVLQKMGMNDLFIRGKANLSGMSDSHNLFMSDVRHKAILEVDEEGATAAAATAGIAAFCCMPVHPKVCVDHPFFVALVCDQTVPVFVGHVTEPESL